jgi:hypothetical protein
VDSFGPLSNTKFKVGTDFSLATPPSSNVKRAKAYACQRGFMLIQSTTNPNKVNIILKPSSPSGIDFPAVRYYIYRGIAKDSFLDGADNIIALNPGVNPRSLENFWTTWNDLVTQGKVTGSPVAENIGYLGGQTTLTNSIDDFWKSNAAKIQAMKIVDEGDWIGDWIEEQSGATNKISFEIIIENDNLKVDLAYCKLARATIDVGALSLSAFELRAFKTKVLAYIDSAAFFGMHYNIGVGRFDSTVGQSDLVLETVLYNDIIQLFETRNRLYIDVRSELGYPYNFYGNYADATNNNITIETDLAATPIVEPYNRLSWPIYYTNTGTTEGHFKLQLRTDENSSPLLYIRNAKNIKKARVQKPFLRKAKLKRLPDTGWTKDIKLKTLVDSTSFLFVANYIQLHYFRQEEASGTNTTIPNITNNLDAYFANIQLMPLTSSISGPEELKSNSSPRLQLIDGDNFSYAAYPQLYKDTDHAIFITSLDSTKFSNQKTSNRLPKKRVKGNGAVLIDSDDFPKNVLFNKILISENIGTVLSPLYLDRYILNIADYHSDRKKRKEDFWVLGLTSAQHDSLLTLASTTGLSIHHGQYVILEPDGGINKDELGIKFRKYKLKIQGLLSDGQVAVSADSGIEIYSLNRYVFCSGAFGQVTNVPSIDIPDPSNIKLWPFVGTAHYTNVGSPKTIQDLGNNNTTSSPEITLSARVFFPADTTGQITIAGLSNEQTAYPLVVVVHGNGHDYTNYDNSPAPTVPASKKRNDLLEYLAFNGFIAVSIDCRYEENTYSMEEVMITDSTGTLVPIYVFIMNGTQYFYNPAITRYRYYNSITGKWEFVLSTTAGTFTLDSPTTPTTLTVTSAFTSQHGMGALGRAHILFHNLFKLKTDFGARVQNNIGLIGHSSGGESVVTAKRLIRGQNGNPSTVNLTGFNNIAAIFSLGPTDQYEVEKLGNPQPSAPLANFIAPYYVLYGFHDGDLQTASVSDVVTVHESPFQRGDPYGVLVGSEMVSLTGFTLWERAQGEEKYMAFMRGATHNGFVTENKDDYNKYDPMSYDLKGSYFDPVTDTWKISAVHRGKKAHPDDFVATEALQKKVLKGVVNAFFRCYLTQEFFWKPLLRGEYLPESMSDENATLSFQYKNKPSEVQAIVYQGPADNNLSLTDGKAEEVLKIRPRNGYVPQVSGGTANRLKVVREIEGRLDFFSPHGLSALLFDLSVNSSVSIYATPNPTLNAGSFTHLSFRVAIVFNYEVDTSDPPVEKKSLVMANLENMKIIFNNDNNLSTSLPIDIPIPIRRYDRVAFTPKFVNNFNSASIITTWNQAEKDQITVGKTKSAMTTVRIAMDAITGLDKFSITDISINFGTSLGFVALDSFEFSN